MVTLPHFVAKLIAHNQHPVTAWRCYYAATPEKCAKLLKITVDELMLIEQSNQHLRPEMLQKLCDLFGVVPEALQIRYPIHTNHCIEKQRGHYEKSFF